MQLRVIHAAFLVFVFFVVGDSGARAQCALPYQLTNGQTADATQVMANFNALATCLSNLPAGATNSVQFNAGSGALGAVGPLTNGQIVIGATGGAPQAATLNAGSGISIAGGPGSITVSATGGGGGGGPAAPVLVQSAFTRSNVSSGPVTGSVTLPSAPTPGNILVAIASGYGGGSTTLAVPSNVSPVYANISIAAVNQGIAIGARVVQAGDGTAWSGFSGGNGGNVFGLFEFSGGHFVQANATQGSQAGATWPFFAGSSVSAYTFFVLENDSTNGYSSISGASLLFDGTNTLGNHPSVIATIAPGTAASAVVNYTGSSFSASLLTTVSIIP